jgi:hypothetical protein
MKEVSVRQLIKKLDTIFSKYIRARDNYTCYTCRKQLEPRYSQAGHFNSRMHHSTRFDERNVHAQCYACNVMMHGNALEYAKRLLEDYGQEVIDDLWKKKHETKHWSAKELQELIDVYKQKLDKLL